MGGAGGVGVSVVIPPKQPYPQSAYPGMGTVELIGGSDDTFATAGLAPAGAIIGQLHAAALRSFPVPAAAKPQRARREEAQFGL